MKTLLRILALAFLACAIPAANTGCQTKLAPSGVYANNPTLYATDSAVTAAFGVLDAFMTFQHANRASLPAEVNAFADRTRRDAPQWAKSILALRDVYASSPTPANKASLDKVLRLVREAVVQASAYLVPQPTP